MRKLKVYQLIRVPSCLSAMPRRIRIYPKIILCGAWLAKAGFDIGDEINVRNLSDKKLLIEVIKKP